MHFLNCDNTELKRSSEIIFSVAEQHRWAVQKSLSYTSLSCKSHSFLRLIGIVSSRILYMALDGRLFSLVRPSQFYVQAFESRLGRITEIRLYWVNACRINSNAHFKIPFFCLILSPNICDETWINAEFKRIISFALRQWFPFKLRFVLTSNSNQTF